MARDGTGGPRAWPFTSTDRRMIFMEMSPREVERRCIAAMGANALLYGSAPCATHSRTPTSPRTAALTPPPTKRTA